MEQLTVEASASPPSPDEKQPIDEGKYLHFILMAETCYKNEPDGETYPFTLEALARMVDAAYNEGRLNQFKLDNPKWEGDPKYVETYTELMNNVESSVQVALKMPDEGYEDEGYVDTEDIVYSGDEEE